MINRQEILDLAREFGLAPNVVEKDYALGWVLAGISNHPDLTEGWIFKGGTCLKKCYFETYRFSEDLDFTLTNPEHLNEEFLVATFKQISEWVYSQSGIQFPPDLIGFEIYQNPRGRLSAQGRLGYRGPLQPGGDAPRIKLDLTADEVLVLAPVNREAHHPYSDRPEGGFSIRCYSFEELFAEKIRALGERERPRDLYDVVHLYRHDELRPDRSVVYKTLEQKCAFKGIAVPNMKGVEANSERIELEAEWNNMLRHQLMTLPPFEQFWQELPEVFDWLRGDKEKAVRRSLSVPTTEAMDDAWRPPSMIYAWHTSTPLEVIRFAAANRLCVDLAYQGSHRLIEPYSLRRTRDGNLLLYAVKHQTGEARSYRVDRIEGTKVTRISFTPRYFIELTPAGTLSALPTVTKPSQTAPRPGRALTAGRGRRFSQRGPEYVFKCMLCGKQFTRTSYNASLNPHKTKQGYPCAGRTGSYVTTRYR